MEHDRLKEMIELWFGRINVSNLDLGMCWMCGVIIADYNGDCM